MDGPSSLSRRRRRSDRVDQSDGVWSVYAFDPTHAWLSLNYDAGGFLGSYVYFTDGTSPWDIRQSSGRIRAMVSRSPSERWTVGEEIAHFVDPFDVTFEGYTSPMSCSRLDAITLGPDHEPIALGPAACVAHRMPSGSWGVEIVPATSDLTADWCDGQKVYAVGKQGTVLERALDGTWIRVDVPVSGDLNGVWGSGPDEIYAVGRNGVILHGP
jgi:hypothetical protein